MTQQEYEYIQAQLSKKLQSNRRHIPYNSRHEEGYREGILAAKSLLSAYYHVSNARCEEKGNDGGNE